MEAIELNEQELQMQQYLLWAMVYLSSTTSLSLNAQDQQFTKNATGVRNIVFDLDGVLFQTSHTFATSHIGFRNLTRYFARHLSFPNRRALFELLEQVPSQSEEVSYNRGNKLPGIMVDWMRGVRENQVILQEVNQTIENSELSRSAKNVYFKIAEMIFDPQVFAQSRKPLAFGLSKLKELAATGKYRLFVLSNWDRESFEEVKKRYPEIFDLFEGEMVSGQVKMVKPSPQIFKLLMHKFGLNPQETVFFDDENHNVQEAKKQGIQAFLWPAEVQVSPLEETLAEDLFDQIREG